MKKNVLTAVMAASLVFFSCEKEEQMSLETEVSVSNNQEIALDFIEVFNEDNNGKAILDQLSQTKFPVSLEEAFSKATPSDNYSKLKNNAELMVDKEEKEVMEMWLHNPENKTIFSDLLVVFAPDNSEDLKEVTAYDLKGNPHSISTEIAPDYPVIVLEKDGFHTLNRQVVDMNKRLKEAGLQSENSMDFSQLSNFKGALETTKLNKIELKDDEEPWIKGGAEIYAITSGIKDADNSPEVKVIPMYYLDHDDRAYYPNQVLLFWDDYRYQAANIQLFEKDSNHNYQELVNVIVSGIFQIAGTLSGQIWVNALGSIGSAIINALPSSWFTDDDDYVDSFYTIEKNKTYTNYYGVRGNAKVNMAPFTIQPN